MIGCSLITTLYVLSLVHTLWKIKINYLRFFLVLYFQKKILLLQSFVYTFSHKNKAHFDTSALLNCFLSQIWRLGNVKVWMIFYKKLNRFYDLTFWTRAIFTFFFVFLLCISPWIISDLKNNLLIFEIRELQHWFGIHISNLPFL